MCGLLNAGGFCNVTFNPYVGVLYFCIRYMILSAIWRLLRHHEYTKKQTAVIYNLAFESQFGELDMFLFH